MMYSGYELIEDDIFAKELEKIGNIEYVDEALGILEELLRTDPAQFPIVPGTKRLRLARTDRYERSGVVIPPLRVYFLINQTDDGNHVLLKYIETIEYEFDE